MLSDARIRRIVMILWDEVSAPLSWSNGASAGGYAVGSVST